MSTFNIKRNDTSPAYRVQLTDHFNDPIDISGYREVSFHLWDPSDGSVVVDATDSGDVSVEDAATGIVSYQWQTGDTADAGTFAAEWEVEYSDGTIETFPNDENDEVVIREDGA